jgi:hypothetical protein
MSASTDLGSKIERIMLLRHELDRLRNQDLGSRPNPPATEDAIATAERHRGMVFPPDFREFLLLHDGWYRFNGQNHILSTDDFQAGPVHENVAAIQETERRNGEVMADGLVIEASESGTDLAYYDPATRKADGGMQLVRWAGDAGEYRRVAGFGEYLENHANSLERRAAKERLRLR